MTEHELNIPQTKGVEGRFTRTAGVVLALLDWTNGYKSIGQRLDDEYGNEAYVTERHKGAGTTDSGVDDVDWPGVAKNAGEVLVGVANDIYVGTRMHVERVQGWGQKILGHSVDPVEASGPEDD